MSMNSAHCSPGSENPLRPSEMPSRAPSGMQAMSAIDRNLKVIAIDDDPFELKLITHQLSMLGQKDVAGFTDPVAALDRIIDEGEDGFDLVFCDLQMPGIDGIAFQR